MKVSEKDKQFIRGLLEETKPLYDECVAQLSQDNPNCQTTV